MAVDGEFHIVVREYSLYIRFSTSPVLPTAYMQQCTFTVASPFPLFCCCCFTFQRIIAPVL